MKKYILLYTTEKSEDNICLTNMFKNNKKIKSGISDENVKKNISTIKELLENNYEELIFSSFENGWEKIIKTVKDKKPKTIIKVICNTQDSLLYSEIERENFFKLLECSKNKLIDEIAFLRKSQYELYSKLGYKSIYLMQNYILDKKIQIKKSKKEIINIGFFPLSYTWDKNIFNQLCVGKMLDNCILNYNCINERMKDFLSEMKIKNNPINLKEVTDEELIKNIMSNDAIISTSFTEYLHPIFFISMELGIPCLCGNNSDLFDNFKEAEKLKEYIVTSCEDNAIINAKKIEEMLKNRNEINKLYVSWKKMYNVKAQKCIEEFIG